MSSRHSIPYTFYPCFSYTTEQQWGGKGYAKPMQREAENPYVDTECKDIVKGLHRKKTPSLQGARWSTTEPSVMQRPVQLSETLGKLDAWSQDLSEGKCNSQQAEFCRRIVEQMKAEMQPAEGATPEPLRWALHGGPGTGKSHTLKLIREELFEQIAGWTRGSQYQIVTLQAVMANDLDGDTIHHALGLNWQSASDDKISGSKFLDLSAKAVQWRWLIIDEISMVSAELLARLDLRCRELVRDLAQSKYARGSAHARPFGGLNVILSGDLWQLPPPRGTFLGEVPWEMLTSGKSRKVAHTVHGQELVWGSVGEKSVVQGLTELVQCERTRDVWLQHVQKEIRDGRLAADSRAFLHGQDTSVPGSWSGEALECGNATCRKLMQGKYTPAHIRLHECPRCKEERASKKRVVDTAGHMVEVEKRDRAKAIFATNAVKYHVNKLRAQDWAQRQGQEVQYAIAKDTISSRALQEKPDLGREKLPWLQRHDQDCGGLYGVLPLCVGMPVTATDHLDRRRGILKGCPGKVVGWSWRKEQEIAQDQKTHIWNQPPTCIFVQFTTKTQWRVQGLDKDNVFPVTLQRQPWHIDKGRSRPMLRVVRRQFPLAPGFATTAHAAQGQTYAEGAITDMQLGEGGDPMTAYIAVTRVRDREGLYIYRPFDASPYQKGCSVGRALLLQTWRGDCIDWATLRTRYREEAACSECRERKPKSGYTAGQWKREAAARVCRECVRNHAANNTPWQCSVCKAWQDEAAFAKQYARPPCTFYRVCHTCEVQKPCCKCGVAKPASAFGASAWKARHADRRCCKDCAVKVTGHWRCGVCSEQKAREHFSAWTRQSTRQNGKQRCNPCVQATEIRAAAKKAKGRLYKLRVQDKRQQVIRCSRAESPDSVRPLLRRSVCRQAIRRATAWQTKVAEEKR